MKKALEATERGEELPNEEKRRRRGRDKHDNKGGSGRRSARSARYDDEEDSSDSDDAVPEPQFQYDVNFIEEFIELDNLINKSVVALFKSHGEHFIWAGKKYTDLSNVYTDNNYPLITGDSTQTKYSSGGNEQAHNKRGDFNSLSTRRTQSDRYSKGKRRTKSPTRGKFERKHPIMSKAAISLQAINAPKTMSGSPTTPRMPGGRTTHNINIMHTPESGSLAKSPSSLANSNSANQPTSGSLARPSTKSPLPRTPNSDRTSGMINHQPSSGSLARGPPHSLSISKSPNALQAANHKQPSSGSFARTSATNSANSNSLLPITPSKR